MKGWHMTTLTLNTVPSSFNLQDNFQSLLTNPIFQAYVCHYSLDNCTKHVWRFNMNDKTTEKHFVMIYSRFVKAFIQWIIVFQVLCWNSPKTRNAIQNLRTLFNDSSNIRSHYVDTRKALFGREWKFYDNAVWLGFVWRHWKLSSSIDLCRSYNFGWKTFSGQGHLRFNLIVPTRNLCV